ncbi:MAG: TetR/AcrR family transcriptional regulator [Atopobiaceae bacterium]|nr:TetR/AcrR family transcriptional regulator [Atopobiaceae bacterium]
MADNSPSTEQAGLPVAGLGLSATDAYAVECASRLFLQRGIEAVRMTDIAEAAGMGVATLYRHFSTKAAIAVAAATLMWECLLKTYDQLAASNDYAQMDGASRLMCLMEAYCEHCRNHAGFAAFIDELDRLILAKAVNSDAVDTYAAMISAAYPYYEQAYQLGLRDASVRSDVDFNLFYRSVGHALMSMSSKLSRGEVLPTDDFSTAREELACVVDMAVCYLRG